MLDRPLVHANTPLDVLSEVLRGLRLDCATFDRSDLGCEFAFDLPRETNARFYFVVRGRCWVKSEASGWLELGPGDAALVPHGAAHRIASSTDHTDTVSAPMRTEIFSGTMNYGGRAVHPLAELMPEVLRTCRFGEKDAFIAGLLEEMAKEAEESRIGGASVLVKLADVLATKLVRSWVECASVSAQGWMAAVRDPQIGRAIAAVHRQPGANWSVEALADIAGASRSKFVERFSSVIGEGPAHYVARWRMQLAMEWLRVDSMSVAQAAQHLGYESEASFSRAFKRVVGSAPAHWKRDNPHQPILRDRTSSL